MSRMQNSKGLKHVFVYLMCFQEISFGNVLLGDFVCHQNDILIPSMLRWFPVLKYLNNMFPCPSDPANPAKLQPPEDSPVSCLFPFCPFSCTGKKA